METILIDTIIPIKYDVLVSRFRTNDSMVRVSISCEGDFTDSLYVLLGSHNPYLPYCVNDDEINEAIEVLTEALEQRRAMHILGKGER